MCAYANNPPSGGWVWSQGQSPPAIPPGTPAMVYQGMPNPPQPYYGQPLYDQGGRGRSRGRGKSSDAGAQNLVTRVKAEVQVARPGQVLEIARFAASQLSSRSPVLYKQLLAGLLGADSQVTVGTEEKTTSSSIIADRKFKWKALCSGNDAVSYWQQLQDRVKAEYGANAEVDVLITEIDDIDLRMYLRGKRVREDLLKDVGLAREGSTMVLCTASNEVGSQASGQPVADTGDSAGKVVFGSNPQDLTNFMSLLSMLVAGQAKGEEAHPASAKTRDESKGTAPPPPRGGSGGTSSSGAS